MELLAYIDAGTGSMFIQAVFGAALAAVVILRSYLRKAFSKVRLAFSSRKEIVNGES